MPRKKTPANPNHATHTLTSSGPYWALVAIVAIAAIAIVAVVGMMKPDSVKGDLGGEKAPKIEIKKNDTGNGQ